MSEKHESKELMLSPDIVHSLVINGDLSKLDPNQKVQYYTALCNRIGLDPITQPFKLIKLQGKEVVYCDRSGTAQLNKIHKISHQRTHSEKVEEVFVVYVKAMTPDGRFTESSGAVNIKGLYGDSLANALMKAETKAKRRATLDLVGLGILDETELETMPTSRIVPTIAAPVPLPHIKDDVDLAAKAEEAKKRIAEQEAVEATKNGQEQPKDEPKPSDSGLAPEPDKTILKGIIASREQVGRGPAKYYVEGQWAQTFDKDMQSVMDEHKAKEEDVELTCHLEKSKSAKTGQVYENLVIDEIAKIEN